MIIVRVQTEAFDPAAVSSTLSAGRTDIGAIVTFTGLVRGDDGLSAMTLEHYPAMTEKALTKIAAEAESRWHILGGTIIHRYGRLEPGDNIVLVAIASSHRADAFAAAEFLMDWLKTDAPFWKKEEVDGKDRWVEARKVDEARKSRWD